MWPLKGDNADVRSQRGFGVEPRRFGKIEEEGGFIATNIGG